MLVNVKVGVKCSMQTEILLSHEAILNGLKDWWKAFIFKKVFFPLILKGLCVCFDEIMGDFVFRLEKDTKYLERLSAGCMECQYNCEGFFF